MTQETKNYLDINHLNNPEGIKKLKLYLKYDLEISSKEIQKMSIDDIVKRVIQDHRDNPIMGS